jgi:hypothetical protein
MAVILSGTTVRFGLMERRSELIRCASITKDSIFDEQIAELDDALLQLWDAKEILLLPEVTH